eukprot:s168_g26.t1
MAIGSVSFWGPCSQSEWAKIVQVGQGCKSDIEWPKQRNKKIKSRKLTLVGGTRKRERSLAAEGDSTALDQKNDTRKEVNFENLTPVRTPAGEMAAQTLPREESTTIRRTMRMSWPRMPGGPFAGRQAVHGRSSAERTYRNKTDAAASSYDVLGPHADGPPLPPVHPLW